MRLADRVPGLRRLVGHRPVRTETLVALRDRVDELTAAVEENAALDRELARVLAAVERDVASVVAARLAGLAK